MSQGKRHTDCQADSAEPTAPLDEIDTLLSTSELAFVCLVITMVTGVWLGLLAFVGGYAWERWFSWLLLP